MLLHRVLNKSRRKALARFIAWTFLVVGTLGFVASAFRIIGSSEPLLVLLLSWAALVYEGFNAVVLQEED